MNQELQSAQTNLPVNNDDYNPYVAFGDSVMRGNIVGQLLRFNKFGDFVAGENSVTIPHGTELIAHMADVLIGWQRWQDSKPTDQVMGFVRDNFQPPSRSELGDTDHTLWEIDDSGKERDPWQKTTQFILKALDNNELYTFSTSSKGGIGAVGRLSKEYGLEMRMHPNQFPVVRLGWSSYEHSNKQYGEIRVPVFEIVGWENREEIDHALGQGSQGSQERLTLEETFDKPPAKAQPAKPEPAKAQAPTKPQAAKQQSYRDASGGRSRF